MTFAPSSMASSTIGGMSSTLRKMSTISSGPRAAASASVATDGKPSTSSHMGFTGVMS